MDINYAVRSLLRQPLFSVGAVLTLALGIGVNSTIFTFANAALFRPMPGVADPDALVWVSPVWRDRGREIGMSYPEYVDYQDGTAAVFSDLFAFRNTPLSLGSGGEPLRVRGQLVTGSFFSALGVSPAAGRLLGAADDRAGSAPAVVLSHALWQRRFGGAPDVLSSGITINGRQFAVVGVAADGFYGPALGETADIWIPLALLPDVRSSDRALLGQRGASWLPVMGRLRPGATQAQAQAAAAAIAARLEGAYPDLNANRGVRVSSARSGLAPESRGELLPLSTLLLIVTGIVLLIACANVANLLLARGAARSLELGIRASLGASRGRLLRQLLTESVVLALAGAVAGLIVSFWLSDILQARLPEAEFRGLYATADLRVVLFTAALASVSICVFGLLPALTMSRTALVPRLRETAASGGRSRLQSIFVVAQLSLSLVLLLAGGLSLRALQKSNEVDLGFDAVGVFTASYDLELQNYTPNRRVAFRRQLRERLGGLPGVSATGIASMPPLGGTMVSTIVASTDDAGANSEARTYLNAASAGFFDALQMPIVKGRSFADSDTTGSPRVAIVNDTLARQLWSEADPIGRRILHGRHQVEVIGLTRTSKYDEITEDPRPFMYVSIDQDPQLDRETVLIRTTGSPASLTAPVRSVIQRLDPALPVFGEQPLSDVLRDRADKQRAISALLAGFGGVALLLAALGLYSVMAYAVSRRTREMGIRIALGASPSQLTSLIARDGLRLSLYGVVIGAVLSLPMAYALGVLVFGVQIADLAAFLLACAVLVGVGMTAALLPARRVARLDPIMALRTE